MLDSDTKRRIDTARDILVGKVPDPKSQVEQITIALIYKFMDDMDAESEEFGGKRSFFAGEFARYGWTELMRAGLGGHETLNLYAEAIAKMPENPGIPPLFRDIFNNAYLPYRDPETLRAFLRVIDEFTYDHSERLGDAFEYLLSVLGSQGDAGQFRTPRHIIDFIVAVIEPKKGETVLDPACGTAGFLISSYKHILAANTDPQGGSTLTPDDKARLAANFKGYDISPDMVRLSLVNLYLHGFADPHIFEYDTLTSEERWNEYADVILANPPFMSPKGGIRPHNRFSVQSKRSEVLFVDYMAEHLMPSGRAGIIVPEGIIFQSQNAYKQLRKMLVEEYLVAVVSLPAGVFNPYSGVKTSILILDKSLAKKTDRIGFFKVESDGFDLGAQRRPIDKDDLPQVRSEIGEYLRRLREGEPVDDFEPTLGLIVEKGKLAASGEYNLSGERYRDVQQGRSSFALRQFEDVCTLEYGASLPKAKRVEGSFPVVGSNGITGYHSDFLIEGPAIVIGRKGSAGEVTFIQANCFPIDTTYYVKQTNSSESDLVYLYWVLKSLKLQELRGGAGIPGLNRSEVYQTHKIPLPPLEVQEKIVAEIEGYQKVIDGARGVVDNYRPHIAVDPEWPMVELGEICDVRDGTHDSPKYVHDGYPLITSKNLKDGSIDFIDVNLISREDLDAINRRSKVDDGDILMPMIGTIGNPVIADASCEYAVKNVALIKFHKDSRADNRFLKNLLASAEMQSKFDLQASGSTQRFISLGFIRKLQIPLPLPTIQLAIVAEIEAEQELVSANRELIARFEKKTQATLARVWGEAEPNTVEA